MASLLGNALTDWSPIGIVGKIFWLVQIGLVIHALRTGRPYWWIWVLIGAPVIGGIAYVFVELVPELRVGRGPGLSSWKPRSWRIKELRAEVEENGIVKYRLALAEELHAAGKYDEAAEAAEECLQGVFRNDPHTLACVARYRLDAGKYAEALDAVDQIRGDVDRMLIHQITVLRGVILVQLGRHAEGQEILRQPVPGMLGDERNYYLALSLQQSGNVKEARATWEEIRKRYRRASRAWHRTEKRWFKLSGQKLKETR